MKPTMMRSIMLQRHSIKKTALRCISSKIEAMHKLFNSQVTNEMNASQLYLSASIWCNERELTGMASFTLKESEEERAHAIELVDFGLKREIPISLEALQAPDSNWNTPEDLWNDLLEAEKANSQALYKLADAASSCHDHAVTTFLMPFHSEQVDAVADMKTILAKVKEDSSTPGLIRQLDRELEQMGGADA